MTSEIPSTPESRQLEKVAVEVYTEPDGAVHSVAERIASLIRERVGTGRNVVLGLATGSTPVRLYRELIRRYRDTGLSFANVVTFNLDEYFGIRPEHPESYVRFMREQLFDHIDVPADQIHIPDGTLERADVFDWCCRYEEQIGEAGGLDMQILGIGRTGHIGFNEPGSTRDSRTRLVTLDALTRRDAARDFYGEENVPRNAITMGVGTILDAREIVLLAWGAAKAGVIARAAEEAPSERLPASFLQLHDSARFLVDAAAASRLARFREPWRVGPVDWTPDRARQASTWLALRVDKPILKLTDEDFLEQGLGDLVTDQGPAYDLNIQIFNRTQHTITGWPGGKPGADDSARPERAKPFPKRVLVLSPEPQDDMIGMGGTLARLVANGHDVTVAYLASGSLAVPDEEARRLASLLVEFERVLGEDSPHRESPPAGSAPAFARNILQQLAEKGAYDLDSPALRRIKALIRREESRSACRLCGLDPAQVRFLDLPFYEEGRYRQFQPGDADRAALRKLVEEVQPHQIFACGDRADPASVTGIAYALTVETLAALADAAWMQDCRTWLFRRTVAEWEPHEIDMAVPLSPTQLALKNRCIYQHLSQRSQRPSTAGSENREIWQESEFRNRETARLYDALGLAEYEAIEAFRRG